MAAEPAEEGIRIILILPTAGLKAAPVGSYLASYTPEGANGTGIAQWTGDPAQAMTFARRRPRRRATAPSRPTARSAQMASRTAR
jgi:hypothetical protein